MFNSIDKVGMFHSHIRYQPWKTDKSNSGKLHYLIHEKITLIYEYLDNQVLMASIGCIFRFSFNFLRSESCGGG